MAMFKAIGQEVAPIGQKIASPDIDWNQLGKQDWDYLFY
jgi:hypothetical protein